MYKLILKLASLYSRTAGLFTAGLRTLMREVMQPGKDEGSPYNHKADNRRGTGEYGIYAE
jgi:hypothetical protein